MVNKPGSSHFWSGLMKIKDQFFRFGSFQVKNGRQVRFWKDIWVGNATLQRQFPMLYNVVRRKDELVANVMSTSPLNISFRRPIVGTKLIAWNELLLKISNVQLSVHKDVFQ